MGGELRKRRGVGGNSDGNLTRSRTPTIVSGALGANPANFLDQKGFVHRIRRLASDAATTGKDLGLIPDDKIAEIRARAKIAEIIGEYVSLRKAGRDLVGLCPFHSEKSPSFNVIESKQFFHCFGCGKSGDVFRFIMELDGKQFVDVARDLAKRYGVDLPEPPRSIEERRRLEAQQSERQRLLDVNQRALEFYRRELAGPRGEAARAYLAKRHIGQATQDKFGVGFAPAGWDALTRYFESERVPHELCEKAGLIRRRDNVRLAPGAPPTKTTHFDVFVERVVYALTSSIGEVLGFGGRILVANPEQPKYKNSPETVLYKKGENLFGLSVGRHAIRKTGRAIVVEGNFDVMSLHEHGFEGAVAPQGTAITEAQVALLGRFAREVVLMLDADPAGRAATLKVIRTFVEQKLPVRIAQLRSPDGKKLDPDEVVQQNPERMRAILDGAVDAIEFFFTQAALSAEPSVPGKVKALDECLPLLRAVDDPRARELYAGKVGELLGLQEAMVRRALRGGDVGAPGRATAPTSGAPPTDVVAASPRPRVLNVFASHLLALLGANPELVNHVPTQVLANLGDEDLAGLLTDAIELGELDLAAFVDKAPAELRSPLVRALRSEQYLGLENPRRTLESICQKYLLPDDTRVLEAERQKALAEGNLDRVRELTARLLGRNRTAPRDLRRG